MLRRPLEGIAGEPGQVGRVDEHSGYGGQDRGRQLQAVPRPKRAPRPDKRRTNQRSERHRKEKAIGPAESNQQAPGRCAKGTIISQFDNGARASKQEQRLGVHRAVEKRKRIRSEKANGPRGFFGAAQINAREPIEVDQTPQKRHVRDEDPGEDVGGQRAAEQPADDVGDRGERREERDVLLGRCVRGIPSVSTGGNVEIPARIPADGQVRDLVARDPVWWLRRRETHGVHSEKPHGQDHRARDHERGPHGAPFLRAAHVARSFDRLCQQVGRCTTAWRTSPTRSGVDEQSDWRGDRDPGIPEPEPEPATNCHDDGKKAAGHGQNVGHRNPTRNRNGFPVGRRGLNGSVHLRAAHLPYSVSRQPNGLNGRTSLAPPVRTRSSSPVRSAAPARADAGWPKLSMRRLPTKLL